MTTIAQEIVSEFHSKVWDHTSTPAFLTKLFGEFDTIEEHDEHPGIYVITFNDNSWITLDNNESGGIKITEGIEVDPDFEPEDDDEVDATKPQM